MAAGNFTLQIVAHVDRCNGVPDPTDAEDHLEVMIHILPFSRIDIVVPETKIMAPLGGQVGVECLIRNLGNIDDEFIPKVVNYSYGEGRLLQSEDVPIRLSSQENDSVYLKLGGFQVGTHHLELTFISQGAEDRVAPSIKLEFIIYEESHLPLTSIVWLGLGTIALMAMVVIFYISRSRPDDEGQFRHGHSVATKSR